MGSPQRGWSAPLIAPVTPRETQHRERVLCAVRLALAACSLIALHFDPHLAGSYWQTAEIVSIVYLLHSAAALSLTWFQHADSTGLVLIHVGDVLWPALIVLFAGGPNSPFFVLFAVPLLVAAFRWGQQATFATAFASAFILISETAFATSAWGETHSLVRGGFRFDEFAVQVISVLVLGIALGHLAEREHELRIQAKAASSVIRIADPAAGVNETIEEVLSGIAATFKASRVVLALEPAGASSGILWSAAPGSGRTEFSVADLREPERRRYFFPMPGRSWHLKEVRREAQYRMVALDGEGQQIERSSCALPDRTFSDTPFSSLAAARITVGDWSGRIFLFDLKRSFRLPADLRFLQELTDGAALAVHAVYLRRQSRARARAIERARIARDLHDGAIQSLIALEMRVETLRRQAASAPAGAAENLEGVRDLLRNEVINLRKLMQELQSEDVSPRQLGPHLQGMLNKFQRETGIRASFTSQLDTSTLSSYVTREVARIVYEALTNVRKHGGARAVRVGLQVEDSRPKLVIEDDGRGFEFSGRLSQVELDASGEGPQVIKDRVRSIGGDLAIESRPSLGSRLEIRFAANGHG